MPAHDVLIIAAEASSSLYAQRLLETWKRDGVDVRAFGIGSRDMEKLGFECLGRSEELAVVGVQEVVAHLPQIVSVFNRLVSEARKRRPKFALLLDYPDFNFRLAKKLKGLGIKVVYYISPQMWAWRRGRVNLVRKYMDRMLVLFPFEVEFYRKHGIQVDFVGHPALDEMNESLFDENVRIQSRRAHGIGDDEIVLALMPGSRRSEIKHHLQTQIDAARLVLKARPGIKPILLVAPTLDESYLRERVGDCGFELRFLKEAPLEMIKLADVALVASGTATLMVGLMEKPMVIMYRMNALTAFLAKRLVTDTPYFGMVNLVMGREVAPELFQEEASPERLSSEILTLAEDGEKRQQALRDLKEMKRRLGNRGATENVARILSGYLNS